MRIAAEWLCRYAGGLAIVGAVVGTRPGKAR